MRMTNAVLADEKPKVLFKAKVDRSEYTKRFRWALIGVLATAGVWVILLLPDVQAQIMTVAWIPENLRGMVMDVGQIVSGGLLFAMAIRLVINVVLMNRRKTEQLIFYDRGFKWKRGDSESHSYGWNALKSVRENPRAFSLRKRKLLQWGDVTFNMRDGEVFKLTTVHGDLDKFIKRVSPYYSDVIGVRMGQRVRLNKSFKVHPSIGVTSAGLLLDGKRQVEWKRLKVKRNEKELIIAMIDDDGIIQTVKKVPTHEVDNLGGFIELTESVAETFQRPNPYA